VIPTTLLSLAFATLTPQTIPQPVEKVKKSKIYSNVKIEGTEFIRSAGVGLDNKELDKLLEAVEDAEKPHVYLVRGSDLVGAMSAHLAALSGDAKPEGVVSAKGTDHAKADVWVAAYLGNGSGTAEVRIRGVEVSGEVIRVLVAPVNPSALTTDSKPYLVWANFGQLASGSYTLQIIEGETLLKAKAVATRAVKVEQPK
jgi:hypothetical protein